MNWLRYTGHVAIVSLGYFIFAGILSWIFKCTFDHALLMTTLGSVIANEYRARNE